VTWLVLYLAPGALLVVAMWVGKWLGEWRRWRAAGEVPQRRRPALLPTRAGFRDEVVMPVGLSLLAVAAWPLLVGIFVRSWWSGDHVAAPPVDRSLVVTAADLVEPLTVDAIESRERVSDPLGAVPDLPFGHLNPAWQRFLQAAGPEARLWSFRAVRDLYGGATPHLGYASVVADTVTAHFLVECEPPAPE
jgi:hypothetical protein